MVHSTVQFFKSIIKYNLRGGDFFWRLCFFFWGGGVVFLGGCFFGVVVFFGGGVFLFFLGGVEFLLFGGDFLYSTVWYSAVHSSTVLYSTVQYSTHRQVVFASKSWRCEEEGGEGEEEKVPSEDPWFHLRGPWVKRRPFH